MADTHPHPQNVVFRPQDEVCAICEGHLVFGTLERKVGTEADLPSSSTSTFPVNWNVKWAAQPDISLKRVFPEDQVFI